MNADGPLLIPEEGVPWCEPCRSYHVPPRDADHHRALRCRAAFPPAPPPVTIEHEAGPGERHRPEVRVLPGIAYRDLEGRWFYITPDGRCLGPVRPAAVPMVFGRTFPAHPPGLDGHWREVHLMLTLGAAPFDGSPVPPSVWENLRAGKRRWFR